MNSNKHTLGTIAALGLFLTWFVLNPFNSPGIIDRLTGNYAPSVIEQLTPPVIIAVVAYLAVQLIPISLSGALIIGALLGGAFGIAQVGHLDATFMAVGAGIVAAGAAFAQYAYKGVAEKVTGAREAFTARVEASKAVRAAREAEVAAAKSRAAATEARVTAQGAKKQSEEAGATTPEIIIPA